MTKQTATEILKERIDILEKRQIEEGKLLKDEFNATLKSLNPVNLIKNSFQEIIASVEIKNTFFETVLFLINGYLTNKVIKATDVNPLVKIVISLFQLIFSKILDNNKESILNFIFQWIEKLLPSIVKKNVETGAFSE